MAISEKDLEGGIRELRISNGDLEALDQVVKKHSFSNTESFLKYIVNVMYKAEEPMLKVKIEGELTTYKPASNLLKKNDVQSEKTEQ